MVMVYRTFVEKRQEHALESGAVFSDLSKNLQIKSLMGVQIFNRYDVQGISEDVFEKSKQFIFSEPQVDVVYDAMPTISGDCSIFAIEYLPGQYDQRADSCAQCISLLTGEDRPIVKSAKVYVLLGNLSKNEVDTIKEYLINPVESREATLDTYATLNDEFNEPEDVKVLDGFIDLDKKGLIDFIKEYGLAMDDGDIGFCQGYFKDQEKRNPTITEIRMIDTYWSDHCRHTTFATNIQNVDIEPAYIKDAYNDYMDARNFVYGDREKDICLMDLATIAAKKLKKQGLLFDLDESEEINACSVKAKVNINGVDEDWLLMFKNETHNHPTEIEPFGGAATCLGGAIRDPLSGRVYVYNAMRVTGAADPRKPLSETIKGKLPQRKIVRVAANGYSSYGNQIGLATGQVSELYHPGYVAKRMEIGAVVGAAPEENVVRTVPENTDVIVLIGGKTGRDGCGGATGSSKSHTADSITTCGAEVQKGNPPEERKIQRLFRNPSVTKLIKRCNDFGAGGVSVAIGELADSLIIDLDAVPKKYNGLDGTELAISESQERMAVVVKAQDKDKIIALAKEENLQATHVATVTDKNRLEMTWRGKKIVDISRDFLNSNGAKKYADIKIQNRELPQNTNIANVSSKKPTKKAWLECIGNINVCSQKGLSERFDSTIGASSVFMPFGGKNQLTPNQTMIAKFPVLEGETNTSSAMAYGFNPYLSELSPFHGAMNAVVESVTKLVASGCELDKMWLTFQEYFPRVGVDPKKWGLPFEALLGAMQAQLGLGLGAIGGKDSMSGTFENIDVPPTLVSFAVSIVDASIAVSPEFKQTNSVLSIFSPKMLDNNIYDYNDLKLMYKKINDLIKDGKVLSAYAITSGGVCEAVTKMAIGNDIGFTLTDNDLDVFEAKIGSIIIETEKCVQGAKEIGHTNHNSNIEFNGETIDLQTIKQAWLSPMEEIFPLNTKTIKEQPKEYNYTNKSTQKPKLQIAKPRIVIPVFPGTNCEYDTKRAFERAGGQAEIVMIRNLSKDMINESVTVFEKAIKNSQIIMIPGGFSGGDEPDGSGKFISIFFRNAIIKDAVNNLVKNRDGLMLGICNGFQALVKLGLVPFGEIVDTDENCPTLTFNNIGRHQSKLINTRISSVNSPWLANSNVGDIHTVPISHGEGRFVASDNVLATMEKNGQIATQYVDENGKVTYDINFNPNGSINAIEGITSPDGRVFGKMGHSERVGSFVHKNVPGNKDQGIFNNGVNYFS